MLSALEQRLATQKTDETSIQPTIQPNRPMAQKKPKPSVVSSMIPDMASGGSLGKTLLGQ
jgi:hypothetical protein